MDTYGYSPAFPARRLTFVESVLELVGPVSV